jgi:diguanylate cyclase (GGDEF)-like protein
MSFTVEEVIHFFYLYILVYMMMSIYIIIFPLIQFMITLILTLAGCYMIYQIDPDDPIFYFTIIVIGLLTILLNFTRYHQEVSIYLANNRHYEDMDLVKSLKDRDHLTNLYNNKFIFHQLNHATHLYTRYHSPLTIMFVDIDNFRNINEKYGQVFGDHIITTIANMIISSSRDTDLAARYSGKKFLIMLQNTNLNDSILFAERIRVICQQFDFETEENITLSIGLKTYDGTPLDMFIEQTLLLLREAKLNGKNNVQY